MVNLVFREWLLSTTDTAMSVVREHASLCCALCCDFLNYPSLHPSVRLNATPSPIVVTAGLKHHSIRGRADCPLVRTRIMSCPSSATNPRGLTEPQRGLWCEC